MDTSKQRRRRRKKHNFYGHRENINNNNHEDEDEAAEAENQKIPKVLQKYAFTKKKSQIIMSFSLRFNSWPVVVIDVIVGAAAAAVDGG